MEGWGKILPQMGFYDYYGHYYFFGPWGVIHKMREDLPAFKDAGGTFLVIEAQPNFAMNGSNLYIASRLAWDIDADVDELMEEYFTKFYGPAAQPMRNFWLGAERYYALLRPGADSARRVGANPQFWAELDGYLKQAEQIVSDASIEKRFRDRVAFNREGFELGKWMYESEVKYFSRDDDVDFAGAIADLEQRQEYLKGLKAKYPGEEGYWPTLLASYFYPDLEQLKTMQKAAEERKKNPPAAQGEQPEDSDDEANFDWLTPEKIP